MTDCVFLFGPRACGKSTVGRALHQKLNGWSFLDLDYEFRLEFERYRNPGTPESPRDYYEGCRKILLEATQKNNLVVALGGGTLINDVAPEIGMKNLIDCRQRGKMVLVLPSRFNGRCKRIIAEREARRHYALPSGPVHRQFDNRIEFMRNNADFTVYGCCPETSAGKIMRHFHL